MFSNSSAADLLYVGRDNVILYLYFKYYINCKESKLTFQLSYQFDQYKHFKQFIIKQQPTFDLFSVDAPKTEEILLMNNEFLNLKNSHLFITFLDTDKML